MESLVLRAAGTAWRDVRAAAVATALVAGVACAGSAPQRPPAHPAAAAPSPPAAAAEPSALPTPAPSSPAPATVVPAGVAPAQPAAASVLIGFQGLPAGSYPVHLHSACNGAQAFHIARLPNLSVNAAGSASLTLASSDTSRGWCLIVYADASLRSVLVTRSV